MRRNTRVLPMAALAVMLLASAAAAGTCHDGYHGGRGRGTSYMHGHTGRGGYIAEACGTEMVQELACLLDCADLTDGQVEQLRTSFEEAEEEIEVLVEECHTAETAGCHDASGLLATPLTADEIDEMISSRMEAVRARTEILAGLSQRVREVLTEEQLEGLASMEAGDCACRSGRHCH